MRGTRATIDLDALRHNLQRVRSAAPNSRVMAAIKANGYGHGLVRVAKALDGADGFGVASIEEAIELRESGIEAPITLLEGFYRANEIPLLGHYGLQAVIHRSDQLAYLDEARLEQPVPVWIKVETGMHRLGFPPGEVAKAWEQLKACGNARAVGFMTHLANADDTGDPATIRQVEVFEAAVRGFPGERAIANSAGVVGWPRTHVEWVRPGIMLYGVSPLIGRRGRDHGLKPVMTLQSELIAVTQVRAGERVGYGGTWTCPEDMPVGVAAIGYGDGYPRHAKSGTPVLLNGLRMPLIGRVSMDMITLDLRTLPDARPGDRVTLWGNGLPVEEVAEWADTIAYELLCGVTRRVPVVVMD